MRLAPSRIPARPRRARRVPPPAVLPALLLLASPMISPAGDADFDTYFPGQSLISLPGKPYPVHVSRQSSPGQKRLSLFSLRENRHGEILLLFPDRFALTGPELSITPGSAASEYDMARRRLPAELAAAGPHESGEWHLITRDGTFLRYHPAEGFLEIIPLDGAPRDRWLVLPNGRAARIRGSEISLWDPFRAPGEALAAAPVGALPAAAAPAPGSRIALLDALTMELSFYNGSQHGSRKHQSAETGFAGETTSLEKPEGSFFFPQALAILQDGRILAGGSAGSRGRLILYSPSGQQIAATGQLQDCRLPPSFTLRTSSRGSIFLLDQQNQRLFRLRTDPMDGTPEDQDKTQGREPGQNSARTPARAPGDIPESLPWEYSFCRAAGTAARNSARGLNYSRADQILSWIEGYARRQRAQEPLNEEWSRLPQELLRQKENYRRYLLRREDITLIPAESDAPPGFRFQMGSSLNPDTPLQTVVATPYGRESLPSMTAEAIPRAASQAAGRLIPADIPKGAAVPRRIMLTPAARPSEPQIFTLPDLP